MQTHYDIFYFKSTLKDNNYHNVSDLFGQCADIEIKLSSSIAMYGHKAHSPHALARSMWNTDISKTKLFSYYPRTL